MFGIDHALLHLMPCHAKPTKDLDAQQPVGLAQAFGATLASTSLTRTLCCCKAQVPFIAFTCQRGAELVDKESYADHIVNVCCHCQGCLAVLSTAETCSWCLQDSSDAVEPGG